MLEELRRAAERFKAALQTDDRTGMVEGVGFFIHARAPLGPQWPQIAQHMLRWGETELALGALECWRSQGGKGPDIDHEAALALARIGRSAEALAKAESLPSSYPSTVGNAYLKGALATNLGHKDEAAAAFRRALAADPGSGRSWLGLAQLGLLDEEEIARMKQLSAHSAQLEKVDQAALENALGIVAHEAGDYGRAFDHFTRSTHIQAQGQPYDPADNADSARLATSWGAQDIKRIAETIVPSDRAPIFVTGLPRSGTTLVERFLSSHSQVDGGGELGLALQIEATVGGFTPRHFSQFAERGGDLASLRRLYQRLAGERIAGEKSFVDKTLNLSRAFGPLAALFPESRFLWLRRDPADNAWSIYRSWLANNAVAGWSLANIADHMKNEDRLLDHWRQQLGDRLLEVPYAEVVDDADAWIDRITHFCGLEPEPDQYDFHNAAGGVTTASSMQVREPVNRRGIGVAAPYREFLQPFFDVYGEA